MSSRDLILGRVRRALVDVPKDDTPYEHAVSRDYLREHGERTVEETVDLLAENLADYRAIVHRCEAGGLAALIAGLLAERGATSVLVPPGLDLEWLAAAGAERVPDRAESTAQELDQVNSVVT
ncbi:lactate utilization protein C, partial [Streptomyces sp. NPDC001795]